MRVELCILALAFEGPAVGSVGTPGSASDVSTIARLSLAYLAAFEAAAVLADDPVPLSGELILLAGWPRLRGLRKSKPSSRLPDELPSELSVVLASLKGMCE